MRTLSGAIVILASCVLFRAWNDPAQIVALLLVGLGVLLVALGIRSDRPRPRVVHHDRLVDSVRSFVTQSDES